jgi:hypothetical protein
MTGQRARQPVSQRHQLYGSGSGHQFGKALICAAVLAPPDSTDDLVHGALVDSWGVINALMVASVAEIFSVLPRGYAAMNGGTDKIIGVIAGMG